MIATPPGRSPSRHQPSRRFAPDAVVVTQLLETVGSQTLTVVVCPIASSRTSSTIHRLVAAYVTWQRPIASSVRAGARTALCSIALVMMCPPRAKPSAKIAWLSASVPPDVKITVTSGPALAQL